MGFKGVFITRTCLHDRMINSLIHGVVTSSQFGIKGLAEAWPTEKIHCFFITFHVSLQNLLSDVGLSLSFFELYFDSKQLSYKTNDYEIEKNSSIYIPMRGI